MNYVKNMALVSISTLFSLLVLEGLMQGFIDPSRLYSNIHTVPALNQWKREVKFWSQYRNRDKFAVNHDPQLGWDFESGQDRIRGTRTISETPPDGKVRIVAVGDSFTYGLDVTPDENFVARLNRADGVEALNMGVAGYGIDQAYLKYLAFGRKYQPDVVIFGIYVGDYERSALGFTSFAKPRFDLSSGEPTLVGQPVPTPQEELARIDRALDDRIYVWEAGLNFWRKISVGEAERARFFAQTDTVVQHVLSALQQTLTNEQMLLIVHIPRGEAFIERDGFRDEMSRRLLHIYDTLGIQYIDLAKEFVVDHSGSEAAQHLYVNRDDGSIGHLSADGHARVAQLILRALHTQGMLRR